MRSLTRTRSGVFTIDDALTLEDAKETAATGTLYTRLIKPDVPLQHLPQVTFASRWRKKIAAGCAMPADAAAGDLPTEGCAVRAYVNGEFWGIMERRNDQLVWRCQIAPEEKGEA